jgi:hypothetical protein
MRQIQIRKPRPHTIRAAMDLRTPSGRPLPY